MKSMRYPLLSILWIAAAALALAQAPKPGNPLQYVPADAEFLASVNLRQAADSDLVQRLIAEKGGTKIPALIQVIKGLTGVDLMKDLDRGVVWGRMDDNDSVVVIFQGRYKRDALLNILKLNPKYKESEQGGVKIYEWYDEKEKRLKFGAFLGEDLVLIANQRKGLDSAIEAQAKGDGFLKNPIAASIPKGENQPQAWVVLIRPDRIFPNGRQKDTLQAQSALGTLRIEPSAVSVRLEIQTAAPETARDWFALAQGALALGRLQQDNPKLKKLAGAVQAKLLAKGASEDQATGVALDMKIAEADILELIRSKAKAEASPTPAAQ